MGYRQNLDTGEWVEVDAQGNPIAAVPARQGRVFTLPQNPEKVAEEARRVRDQQIQEGNAARDEVKFSERNNPTLKAGYRWKDGVVGGTAEPIPGIPDDATKPTEFQSKSAGFYGRMLRAERQFNAMPEGSRDARTIPGQALHEWFPNLDNTLSTSDRSTADSAALDFVRASLRQESGASINPDEEIKQYRIFFPMPGDGPEQLKAKAAARAQAIAGFRIASGPEAAKIEATVQAPVTPDGQQGQEDDKAAGIMGGAGNGGQGGGGGAPSTPWDNPSDDMQTVATGKTRWQDNPRARSTIASLINAGAGYSTIAAAAVKAGGRAPTMQEFAAVQQWMKQHPGKEYPASSVHAGREVPLTDLQREAGSGEGAAVIGAANGFTMGGLDELAGGVNSLVNGTSYEAERDRAQGAKDAASALHPWQTFGGNVGAGVLSGVAGGLALGGTKLGAMMATLPGMIGTGAGYGALNGALEDNANRLRGAATGGGIGAAGGLVGGKIAGSAAERATRGFSDVGSLTPLERAIPDGVETNLQDASRLGLPYSLADADPKLRALAGSAARKSPNARALAEEVFGTRARGQAERAYDAIDMHLAPDTDLAERGQQWRQAAQTASAPHYAAMRAHSAPMDPQLNAMLDTPVGQAALRDARTIAANEGRNPDQMGFVQLENGDVTFGENPSWETLDFVKRGIDQQLTPYRNQLTGNLVLEGNPQAQAIEGFRQRFVSTLDNLNGDYKNARAAYQGEIQNRDALQRGTKLMGPQVRPRELPPILEGFDERQLAEAQRGAATNMADTVNNTQLSGNPYNRVYGTPAQQEKVGMLFPEGQTDFRRVYDLEGDMGKTAYETIGGSPTAQRTAADAIFESPAGALINGGMQMATGGGFDVAGLARAAARPMADAWRLGLGQKRADQIAPMLFNTDPDLALAYLTEAAAKRAAIQNRQTGFQSKGALLGALLSPALTPSQ